MSLPHDYKFCQLPTGAMPRTYKLTTSYQLWSDDDLTLIRTCVPRTHRSWLDYLAGHQTQAQGPKVSVLPVTCDSPVAFLFGLSFPLKRQAGSASLINSYHVCCWFVVYFRCFLLCLISLFIALHYTLKQHAKHYWYNWFTYFIMHWVNLCFVK